MTTIERNNAREQKNQEKENEKIRIRNLEGNDLLVHKQQKKEERAARKQAKEIKENDNKRKIDEANELMEQHNRNKIVCDDILIEIPLVVNPLVR